jgi:hypothetical protein
LYLPVVINLDKPKIRNKTGKSKTGKESILNSDIIQVSNLFKISSKLSPVNQSLDVIKKYINTLLK